MIMWKKLNHLQLGKYGEYFAKMQFTKFGFDVYSSEVDDKGIDFIIRNSSKQYYEIQVKSIRNMSYVFMSKDKFDIEQDNLFLALVVFASEEPSLYLIKATEWKSPNTLLCDRDYETKTSKPEFGVNISKKSQILLEQYSFDKCHTILLQ